MGSELGLRVAQLRVRALGTGGEAAPVAPRRSSLWAVPVWLPVVVVAWLAFAQRWITDDGFINFRIVRMIEAGHGPVFNAGERVEAHTSVLWIWTLVVGDVVLPLPLEWVAVVLGVAATGAGLVTATLASRQVWRAVGAGDRPFLPAGTVVLAALPPVWDFATSGLEGGLAFGWIGAVALVLARWATHDRLLSRPAGVLLGLGPLLRPDLALVSLVTIGAVVAVQWPTATGWRRRLAPLVAAGALPVAYQVFRMGYYAALVPNTALAKAAGSTRWGQGWFYVRNLLDPYWLHWALVVVAVAVGGPLVRRAVGHDARAVVAVLALPAAGLLSTVYMVRTGGDYMHARLLLPALWLVLVPFAVVPLPRRSQPALVVALGAITAWAIWCGGFLRAPISATGESGWVVDARPMLTSFVGDNPMGPASIGWGPGSPIANLPPSDVYVEATPVMADPPDDLRVPANAAFAIGLPGYVHGPDVYVLDRLGLADPVGSRLEVHDPRQPGHEKLLPDAWLVARLSRGHLDLEDLPLAVVVPGLHTSAPHELRADAAAARRALRCHDVEELLDAVREPLTPGRFLDNLVSAPRLTFLEIPPDPDDAQRTLCGAE